MDYFGYREGESVCEGVSLRQLAADYGTPVFAYSRAALISNCRRFREAFGIYPTLPCYAVKANGNLSLLREISSQGFGADVVSQGELERALLAGVRPDHIVFSGVGKTAAEIRRALTIGVLCLNAESEEEIRCIADVARDLKKTAPLSLRINPNIDAKTLPHIATGLHGTKFGIAEPQAAALLDWIRNQPSLKLIGISCHIGSQIVELGPFREAARRIGALAQEWKSQGVALEHIDLGGGLGIRYQNETPPPLADYARALFEGVRGTGLRLIIEPGRSVIANTGVLITKVLRLKQMPSKVFVIVDAAMTELVRPSLYNAFHSIAPLKEAPSELTADIVGPVCESGDYLGRDRALPKLQSGDLLMVRDVGAYGMSMASHYNTRPSPAEVLVDGGVARLICKPEPLESLWALET